MSELVEKVRRVSKGRPISVMLRGMERGEVLVFPFEKYSTVRNAVANLNCALREIGEIKDYQSVYTASSSEREGICRVERIR